MFPAESTRQAFIAATRFGFGARPGDLDEIASDPRGWLEEQLEASDTPESFAGLATSQEHYQRFDEARRAGTEALVAHLRGPGLEALKSEGALRTLAAVRSETPFRERWVQFWGNHFTVSSKRFQIASGVGSFEREAIRPNVMGRFQDLVLASTQHSVMLLYLDNTASMGARSMAGVTRSMGLNENLAREVLELHTLGVHGGYTQGDVVALAKLITGWGIAGPDDENPGTFIFRRYGHEPGSKELLGVRYRQGGHREGETALRDIANHPSTARFVATKLARHFVADDPPAAVVERLTATFMDSGGDLRALAKTLIAAPEVWSELLPKFKTPNDLVISTLRAFNATDVDEAMVVGALFLLGQFPFSAPSPAGWPDVSAEWIAPEAVLRRLEWLQAVAGAIPVADALGHARGILGQALSDETEAAMAGTSNLRLATALMLASPEFQRR